MTRDSPDEGAALTLAQVARSVGFPDEAQLARVFRQCAGEEPGAFRRRRGRP